MVGMLSATYNRLARWGLWPSLRGEPSEALMVYRRDVPEAFIKLNKPKAGDWRIIPNDGSPAITEVLIGEGFKPATVKAKLGRGHRIGYRIRGLGHGQKVQATSSARLQRHAARCASSRPEDATASARSTRFSSTTG